MSETKTLTVSIYYRDEMEEDSYFPRVLNAVVDDGVMSLALESGMFITIPIDTIKYAETTINE